MCIDEVRNMKTVMYEVKNHIATITLNRKEAANAMSLQLLTELHDTLYEVKYDLNVRVVILTGSGDAVFCAGADLKERASMPPKEAKKTVSFIGATINEVESLPQPVIAAINGAAFGGGLELALACCIRVLNEQAKVGLTEASLGIIPGAGGTQRLARLIGRGRAKELIYTARRVSATEALHYGIVEHVVPKEAVLQKATELAEEMVKNAPLSLIQAKKAINEGLDVDSKTGFVIEKMAYDLLLGSKDRIEGLQAFKEKRVPNYKGE